MPSILVIDDDETLRDTLAVMLEQEGFTIAQAADGRTGLARALTLKPDLLLVDLRLPGLSGMEVCKQLRSSNIQTPIIVLSAVGGEVDKVLALTTMSSSLSGSANCSPGSTPCSAGPRPTPGRPWPSAKMKSTSSGAWFTAGVRS